METDPEHSTAAPAYGADDIDRAAQLIRNGRVIVYPTETFYGLVAAVFCPEALEAISNLKGRNSFSPFPCLIGTSPDLQLLASRVTPLQETLMKRFWPGPLTLVFDAQPDLPNALTGGTGTIGVRIPGHDGARRLAEKAGPIVATSANLSGQDPISDFMTTPSPFGPDVAVFIGPPTHASKGSTVLDVRGPIPHVIREGDIPVTMFKPFLRTSFLEGMS